MICLLLWRASQRNLLKDTGPVARVIVGFNNDHIWQAPCQHTTTQQTNTAVSYARESAIENSIPINSSSSPCLKTWQ